MKSEPIGSLYERNPVTGNFIIEIALDKYGDVFNEWDHATYRKRDMDPELAFFLEESSAEIPIRYGLDLVFYLPKQEMDKEKESLISTVVKNYYKFYAGVERRTLAKAYQRMLNHILTAVALLSSTYLLNIWQHNFALAIVAEGLTVGSWFFMWEAISFFIFERSDNLARIRTYERLSAAIIKFRYDL